MIEIMERKILRSLERHGMLSQTELYRYFHRYRAEKKNTAVKNLLQKGLINRFVKRTSEYARKPTQFFVLNDSGRKYLAETTFEQIQTPEQ